MLHEHLGRLRSILYEGIDLDPWAALCATLDQVQGEEDLAVALDYVEGHLGAWPDAMRYAVGPWRARFFEPKPDPRLRLVRVLMTERLKLSPAQVTAALAAGSLRALCALDLGGHSFAGNSQAQSTQARRLLEGGAARGLRELRCVECGGGDELVEALLAAGGLEGLEVLDLSRSFLRDRSLDLLARHEAALPALKVLRLSENRLGDAGVAALAASPLLGRLEVLGLSANHIGDAGLTALADAETLVGVRELDLGGNVFSSAGEAAMLSSPWLLAPWRR